MDKKTEAKRLLEKAESQKGIERAKTLKAVLELVSDLPIADDEIALELEFQITFGDGGLSLDAVNVSREVVEKFRQIDEIKDGPELRRYLVDVARDIDQTPVSIKLAGLGRTKIKITSRIGGEEWYQLISRIHGLENKKLAAKKVIAAISCMRRIVSDGMQTKRAPDIHKDDDKKAPSIAYYIKEEMNVPELGKVGVILTIKKLLDGKSQMEAHHVHVEGNDLYVRKLAEAESAEVGGFVYSKGKQLPKS